MQSCFVRNVASPALYSIWQYADDMVPNLGRLERCLARDTEVAYLPVQ